MIHPPHSAPEWLQSSFMNVAETLDLSTPAYYLASHPAQFSPELMDRIKLAAKYLAKTAGAQRSTALEWMAFALQFQNWHQLSSHFTSAPKSTIHEPNEQWSSRLKLALVLLNENTPEMEVPKSQIEAFEHIADRLAQVSGQDKSKVLDAVLARLCAASSWAEVKGRHPLKAINPLYSFRIDEHDEGYNGFVESEACKQLVHMLDARCGENMTAAQEDALARWLAQALKKQPNFFEGGLQLGHHLYERQQIEAARALVDLQLRKANALLPKGYSGKMIWGIAQNRFYHRLLWLQLEIAHDYGDLLNCLRICRRMLKLNPNDNLGARFVIPWLHLTLGEPQKALKAAGPSEDNCSTMVLAKAFAHFAAGNRGEFIRHLVDALFDLPLLRSYLLNEEDLPAGEEGTRGGLPDMELFLHFSWAAYQAIPGLVEACHEVLASPDLQDAELSLRVYWNGFWQKHQDTVGDYDGWSYLRRTLFRSVMLELAPEGCGLFGDTLGQ